ncbi:uncharacterized protein DEA37_0012034 [Paragonimus westermani]|uniref:Ras-associating domain-containing protein n=1 Tax=Paragonimus westermani TaxID=34504 RepID=A0A5J4NIQ9_9TREM|nr:uncharacterized protein DEA37_0012034 [Paragonimus westermani]
MHGVPFGKAKPRVRPKAFSEYALVYTPFHFTTNCIIFSQVPVYSDYFEQGENVQTYSVSSKETAKQLIHNVLRRNHLDLKDPNLFYLTFKIDPVNVLASYESSLGNRPNGHLSRSGNKHNVGTLYSDAILSRTLNLTKDNKLTLEMQEGGTLRIYDNCFSRPPSIRQLYISKTTCSVEAIKLVLTIVGSSESAENYCLVEEEPNDRGRILRPTDYPLLVTRSGSLNSVLILRRIEDALRNEKTRKKPWVRKTRCPHNYPDNKLKLTRSKTFACGSTAEKNSEAEEVNLQAIGNIRRNLLPRFLKSFRRNKTLDSLRGNADIEEALLQIDKQTPSPFGSHEKSSQRLSNGSPFQSTVEEKLVTSSLANPHYLSVERNINRNRTSTAPPTVPTEGNQSASNWSLSPSACMSLPSSARNFSTPPARSTLTGFKPSVTRLGQSESTQNRKYSPPRPPQQVRSGVQTYPRPSNSILTAHSFVKPPAPKVIQFSRSNGLSCTQSSPKHSVNKIGIRPGPETLAAELLHSQQQFLNPSGQTPAEDSPTELERVWARKKLTKYKHTRQTANGVSADDTPTTSVNPSKSSVGYMRPGLKSQLHEYDSPPECSGDAKSIRSGSSPDGRTNKRSSPITLIDASEGELIDALQTTNPLSDEQKKHAAGNYVQSSTSTTWKRHQETVKSRKTTRFHSSNQIYTINGFPGVPKLLQEKPAKSTASIRRLTLPTRFDSDFRSSISNVVENKTETSMKLQSETLKSGKFYLFIF